MNKKLLILQYRTDITKEHEQQCFKEDLHYIQEHIEFRDAIRGEFPNDLSEYAGVIVGGSAEFMLGEGDGAGTWKDDSFVFFDRVIDADIPMLGICFGYQLLALHQGARITNAQEMRETGSFIVHVSEHGSTDPLMKGAPQDFMAQFGHKETIIDPPSHIINLATTDRVALNTFRVQDKKVWGTLAHPELNPERVKFRVSLFPAYAVGQDVDAVCAGLQESPHAMNMVHNFVTLLK